MFTNSSERKKARMQSADFDTLSLRQYNLTIGLVILYGFVLNAIMVATLSDYFIKMSPMVLLIGYVVLCLVGTMMTMSMSPVVSFIGYNLVVVPIGALVSIILPEYDPVSILAAIIATGAIVAAMIAISTIFPRAFTKMGRTLLITLILGLVVEIIAAFLGYGGDVFNWLFVILFSLYIGYDWSRAQVYPRTLDTAVDSALDIYLDIINIFIRLLQIFGRDD